MNKAFYLEDVVVGTVLLVVGHVIRPSDPLAALQTRAAARGAHPRRLTFHTAYTKKKKKKKKKFNSLFKKDILCRLVWRKVYRSKIIFGGLLESH